MVYERLAFSPLLLWLPALWSTTQTSFDREGVTHAVQIPD
jgi:hypothetical protein